MIKINLKATNIALTPAIRNYVDKKVGKLEKYLGSFNSPAIQAWVEVGMTTQHHQSGDIFRAEIQIHLPHIEKGVRAESIHDNLYTAIDEAQEEMKLELSKIKDRKKSLIKKGARLFKKLLLFWSE